MPDANYFRQMAGKCFRQVVLASSPAECERFERRGREFLIKAEEVAARVCPRRRAGQPALRRKSR
jgi:hypothetical protein